MRAWLRFLLRFAAILLLAGATFLVIMRPKATVAGADIVTKVNLVVQCSSVWDQWTHHAQPADLKLNGTSLANLPAAESSCRSASSTIKRVGAALTVSGFAALGVSFLPRRRQRP